MTTDIDTQEARQCSRARTQRVKRLAKVNNDDIRLVLDARLRDVEPHDEYDGSLRTSKSLGDDELASFETVMDEGFYSSAAENPSGPLLSKLNREGEGHLYLPVNKSDVSKSSFQKRVTINAS